MVLADLAEFDAPGVDQLHQRQVLHVEDCSGFGGGGELVLWWGHDRTYALLGVEKCEDLLRARAWQSERHLDLVTAVCERTVWDGYGSW